MFSSLLRRHWIVLLLLTIYIGMLLSVIDWGIPNPNQVFLYHMDEWHQLMSVRSLATRFTTTVEGSAHGSIFHFLTAGAYIGFFHLISVVDLFSIEHSVANLPMQHTVFILLRFSTLLYGVSTILTLYYILKYQLSLKLYWLGLLFFTFTPIWISLSNYFKYDIALTFWISLSIALIFNFLKTPTYKNYLFSAIATALAFDTKISAVPLFAVFFLSYFFVIKNWKKNILLLINGISVAMLVVLVFGLPDLLIGSGDYSVVISDVVFDYPANSYNYNFGSHFWLFLIFNQLLANFGRPLIIAAVFSIFFTSYKLITHSLKKQEKSTILVILIGLMVFVVSLYPLKVFSSGNRMLVLLPWLSILISWAIDRVFRNTRFKITLLTIATIFCSFQVIESLLWLNLKWHRDPREVSSEWIQKNVPLGSTIGIVQPLIYQMAPNVLLQDYSLKQHLQDKYTSTYSYVDVSSSNDKPDFIILTNVVHESHKYFSVKYSLYNQAIEEGYEVTAIFTPQYGLIDRINDPFSISFTNLVPMPTDITILQKK